MRVSRAVWAVPIGALVIALLPAPYGYYMLLRFVVCGAAVFLAWCEWQREPRAGPWLVALGVVALLFNPFAPIHLSRPVWAVLDPLTAALLGAHWWMRGRRWEL